MILSYLSVARFDADPGSTSLSLGLIEFTPPGHER